MLRRNLPTCGRFRIGPARRRLRNWRSGDQVRIGKRHFRARQNLAGGRIDEIGADIISARRHASIYPHRPVPIRIGLDLRDEGLVEIDAQAGATRSKTGHEEATALLGLDEANTHIRRGGWPRLA